MTGDSLFGSLTIFGVGYAGYKTSKYVLKNGKIQKDKLKNVGTSSLVTGVTTTFFTSYSVGRQLAYKTANAYIESLDDKELATLEIMLEEKEKSMDVANELVDSKQLIKKL